MKKAAMNCILLLMLFSGLLANARVPENLNIIYVNDTAFRIIWDASADTFTSSYTLFRSLTPTAGTSVYDGINTYFDDTTVNTNTTYYYKVRANTVSDPAGTTISAVRKSRPLPGGITVTAIPQNSKAMVQWVTSGSTTLTGYSIYRSSEGNANFVKLSSVSLGQPQYLDSGVVNGISYGYRIACRDDNDGALLPGVAGIVPFAAPFAPGNFSGVVTGTANDVLTLNWSAQGIRGTYDVAHFDIYKNIASPVADAAGITGLAYDALLLTKGARHDFKITAEDVKGNSSMPSFVSVYLSDGTMLAPAGLTTTSVTSRSVSLTWNSTNAAGQIDGFRVYRGSDLLAATASTAYTDSSSLTLGSLYSYHIETYRDTAPAATPVAGSPVNVTITPAAPVNLTISQTGAGRLHLLWANTAYEITSIYNVYRTTTAGDFTAWTPVTQTAQALVESGLNTGTTYYYRISAVISGHESAPAETSAKSITLPASPQDITAINGTPDNGFVHLAWTADADYDAHTFNVYYKFATVAASVYAPAGSVNAADKYVTGLKNGMDYNFKVTSTNALGSSGITNARYCTITPDAGFSLAKPLDFRVDSIANSRLSLSWSPVTGAAKYSVFRSLLPAVPADVDSWVNSPSTNSYVDIRPFADNAFYYYKVIAVDSLGNTGAEYSDVYGNSAITRAGPPENVELNNTAGGVLLSWSKPAGEYTFSSPNPLKYRIYSSTASGVFGTGYKETLLTYYEDNAANTMAATLYYRIKSVDNADNEDFGTFQYSIDMSQPIAPPPVLVARPGNHRVTLTWKKVSPEYYNIYRSTDTFSFTVPIAHNIDFNGREYIDTGLDNLPAYPYIYTIAAVTRGGEGPKSMTASAIPYAPPDITYKYVTCAAKAGKNVELKWKIAAQAAGGYGVDKYNIYRSKDNGWTYSFVAETPYHAAGVIADDLEIYTDTDTQWDNKYAYLIKVQDAEGNNDTLYDPAFITLPLPRNRLKLYANLTDLSKGQSLTWQYVLVKGGRIKVNAYTLSGVFVKNLLDEVYSGAVSAMNPYDGPMNIWDGTNAKGRKVASGVYLLVFELNGEKSIEKIAVIR